jgi:hypothetical protein
MIMQGDTSSQSEPGRYLQALQALVQRYSALTAADVATAGTVTAAAAAGGREPLQVLPPLVINTPGWVTGLGLDLLAEVLRCAAPTHGEGTAPERGGGMAVAWWYRAFGGGIFACGGAALLQPHTWYGTAS